MMDFDIKQEDAVKVQIELLANIYSETIVNQKLLTALLLKDCDQDDIAERRKIIEDQCTTFRDESMLQVESLLFEKYAHLDLSDIIKGPNQ